MSGGHYLLRPGPTGRNGLVSLLLLGRLAGRVVWAVLHILLDILQVLLDIDLAALLMNAGLRDHPVCSILQRGNRLGAAGLRNSSGGVGLLVGLMKLHVAKNAF